MNDQEIREFSQLKNTRDAKIIWWDKEIKQFLIGVLIFILFFMWTMKDKSPAKNIDHSYRECNGGLCEYGSYGEMMEWGNPNW